MFELISTCKVYIKGLLSSKFTCSYLNSSGSMIFVTNKSTRTAVNIGATTTVAKAVNNLQDKTNKNCIFYLTRNLYGLGFFLFLHSFLFTF